MKVLITGTSQGIGKAIAIKFLNMGHTVIGLDIKESSINNSNYNHIITDITKELPEINDVEILINNAGIQTQSLADINVNLVGTINVTEKYAFNNKIKSVLNISSASALSGSEFPHYAASKGGVSAYTKNVAQRIAKYKATCNALCPGGVITELNDHILNDKAMYDAVLNEALLKKWASAEEIAEWAYFVTVINKSMTGENLLIDNGEALNFNFIW